MEYDFQKPGYWEGKADRELVAIFNREVGNPGWTSARGFFLGALCTEMKKRFDYRAIIDKKGMSLAKRIRVEGKKSFVAHRSTPI